MAGHSKGARPSTHDKHTNRDTKVGKQKKHESHGGSYKTGGSPHPNKNKKWGKEGLFGWRFACSRSPFLYVMGMKLIIRTPAHKFTAYCAHLIEHCVLSGYKSEKRFFNFTVPYWDARAIPGITQFWVWDDISIEALIQEIQKPLDQKVISNEKKLLNQELNDEDGIGDQLFSKLGKILYREQRKSISSSKKVTQQGAIDYHQQYYILENMRIVDNEHNNTLIKRPGGMKQLDVKEGNKHEEEICFTYKKKKYIAFIRDYSSLENYTLFFFLEWLYDLISLYKHRYLGSSYFYPISHFIQYPDRIAFIHGGGFNAKISFFDRAKTLFLTKEDKTNEIAINYEILSGKIVYEDQVKSIIQQISKEQIDHYLQ